MQCEHRPFRINGGRKAIYPYGCLPSLELQTVLKVSNFQYFIYSKISIIKLNGFQDIEYSNTELRRKGGGPIMLKDPSKLNLNRVCSNAQHRFH